MRIKDTQSTANRRLTREEVRIAKAGLLQDKDDFAIKWSLARFHRQELVERVPEELELLLAFLLRFCPAVQLRLAPGLLHLRVRQPLRNRQGRQRGGVRVAETYRR
jgi:hypothetical protein